MNKEGLKNTVTVFRIKVDLSCKRSMLLVFWHRQRLVQRLAHAITDNPPKSDPPCSAVSLRQLSYLFSVC